MRSWASLRDVALITRFHLLRAVRSRALMAFWALYLLVVTGADWLFTRILLEFEQKAARALGVPETDRPGAMLETLRGNGDLQELFSGLFSDADAVDRALNTPFLAVIHLWIGIGVLPFLAAAAGAETLSGDLRDRTLRFEVVRTGRMEIVGGRFFGQAITVIVAVVASVIGTVIVGAFAMVDQDLWALVLALGRDCPALAAWALPWVGLGVSCSSLTRAPAVARALAPSAVFAAWVAWGLLEAPFASKLGWGREVLGQTLPQAWLSPLLRGGWDGLVAGLILGCMGVAAAFLSWPVFRRRDL